ncbi:MAG: hypothetical protein KAS32_12645 [Candidatus Peribacteraceae bacterium]|nr:hypothetical protein [Candidatus Peribacteraceae bacterium]
MKVYNKLVIDLSTMKVVEEQSFDYIGDVTLCKGGSGGSTSGAVEYPQYMKDIHGDWLDRGGAVSVPTGESVQELMAVAIGGSPYSGETAYDPDSDIAVYIAAIDDFSTLTDALDETTDWLSIVSAAIIKVDDDIIDNTSLAAAATAHGDILDDRLTTDVLPRYEAGMRDINAVISSSFTIGKSILEAFNTREVADFDAKNRMTAYGQRNTMIIQSAEQQLNLLNWKLNYSQSAAHMVTEGYRIKAVLLKEEIDEQLDIDMKDGRWDLETYQYGSNVLSAIAGSAVSTGTTPGKGSVLGGVLSGAAAGASVGGPVGAGIGAAIGGIASLL